MTHLANKSGSDSDIHRSCVHKTELGTHPKSMSWRLKEEVRAGREASKNCDKYTDDLSQPNLATVYLTQVILVLCSWTSPQYF